MHYEFVPWGQTVNQYYYIDTLWHLWESMWWKWLDNCNSGDWFFHHDNSLDHFAVSVCDFVAKNKMTVVTHAVYSSDFALCDFLLCPELKLAIRGRRYIISPWLRQNCGMYLPCFSSVLEMVLVVARSLDSMFKVPRRLVWWGQLEGKCFCGEMN